MDKALLRDNFRCLLSGVYDIDSVLQYPELDARALSEGIPCTSTEVAHIFSESAQDKNKVAFSLAATYFC